MGHRLFIYEKIAMQTASLKISDNLPQNIFPKAVLDGDIETPSYIAPQKRIQRSPSYLYKKGNIFYFRYKFTAKEKEHFQHAEFRISLKTGFVHEAKKTGSPLTCQT